MPAIATPEAVAEVVAETVAPVAEIVAEVPMTDIEVVDAALAAGNEDDGFIDPPEVVPEAVPEVVAEAVAPEVPVENAEVLAELATYGIEKPSTETVNRFKFLNDENHRLASMEPQAKNWQAFDEHMTSIRATPDQVGQAFAIVADINSGDITRLTAVYDRLQETLGQVAKAIGKPANGYDPVAQFADLQAEVEAGLPTTMAQELATRRTQDAFLANQRQQQAQQAQQAQQYEQQASGGREALNQYGEELARIDPLYEQKVAILIPALKPMMDEINPSLWLSKFKAAYMALPSTAVQAPVAPVTRPTLTHQPLRPAGVATTVGGNRMVRDVPKDDIEAMNWAIELANSRQRG